MIAKVHESAVSAAIGAARGMTPADEPLLQLALTLARQVDAAGPDGPGTRLSAAYLTAIRTLTARLGPLVDAAGSSKLAQLRAVRDHAKASQTSRRPAS